MIELSCVDIKYPLTGMHSHSLQSLISRKIGGVLGGQSDKRIEYVHALRNINLKISDGERLGVLGHNGAGKTTLLRVLTGVYPPTSGHVSIYGKINALTDFTLGMEPNVNGIQNIIFRLVFMGYTYKQAKHAIDDIVEFSGLGDFIQLPVRTYSTGMFLRLAFSISTHFTPDILILDEVIGAGDEDFREKALGRLSGLINDSRIVILSSHDLNAVKQYCNKSILMEHGEIVKSGPSAEIVDYYQSKQIR